MSKQTGLPTMIKLAKVFGVLLVAACMCGTSVGVDAQTAKSRIVATGGITIAVDTGGNDENDGITAPMRHICAAILKFYTTYDMANQAPRVMPTSGQVFDESGIPCSFGGQIVGNNVITISPSGAANFTWVNQSASCLAFGDNAEFIVTDATMVCNRNNVANQAAFYLHQYAVLDLNGNIIISGGGSNDVGILLDSGCKFTVANGITVEGALAYIISMHQHARGTLSGIVTFLGYATVGGAFQLSGGSLLALGGSFVTGVLNYIGPSTVTGGSELVSPGVSVPGGVVYTTNGFTCNPAADPC